MLVEGRNGSFGESGRGWDVEMVTVGMEKLEELVREFGEVAGRGGGMGERESWYLGAKPIAES